jgi:hypothetical protein
MNENRLLRRFPILIFLLSSCVFSWVSEGHQTIGYIAQKNLNPATLEKLKPLLEGQTLADISTWADDIKRQDRRTRAWHYINLPVRENISEKDIPRFLEKTNRKNDNIISQVTIEIAELKRGGGTLQDRQAALKFLVHFIEDAHQPLHCADDNDKRGNEKQVLFFPPNSRKGRSHSDNLHALWNKLLQAKNSEDPKELAERINGKFTASQKEQWTSGSIETWVFESYSIAKNRIYQGFPPGPVSVHQLPKNYYDEMRPLVEQQLEKAGVRLAKTLEEVFGN